MPSSIRSRKPIIKLTPGEFRNYNERGYSFPHRALSWEEAEGYRKKLENYEDRNGLIMKSPYSNKPHLVFTWVHELIHNPQILSLAASVLGPNLLVWGTNFWKKVFVLKETIQAFLIPKILSCSKKCF